MLVLSRKAGESVMIGEIEVKITEVSGDRVKIGIQAPRECKIMRKELCQTVESNILSAKAVASKSDLISFISKIEAKPAKESKPGEN
ncbi:MAG: carbon storage regulator CsrA [Oscillospiraceae bacterium]|jgi:carbon storage regulator|nr:carbon storage regulator CsrA [Oscillospiraceae bacterium]